MHTNKKTNTSAKLGIISTSSKLIKYYLSLNNIMNYPTNCEFLHPLSSLLRTVSSPTYLPAPSF